MGKRRIIKTIWAAAEAMCTKRTDLFLEKKKKMFCVLFSESESNGVAQVLWRACWSYTTGYFTFRPGKYPSKKKIHVNFT
jgi:hypothetical protein